LNFSKSSLSPEGGKIFDPRKGFIGPGVFFGSVNVTFFSSSKYEGIKFSPYFSFFSDPLSLFFGEFIGTSSPS